LKKIQKEEEIMAEKFEDNPTESQLLLL